MQCDKKENATSHTLSDVRLFLQPSCQIQLSFTFAPTTFTVHIVFEFVYGKYYEKAWCQIRSEKHLQFNHLWLHYEIILQLIDCNIHQEYCKKEKLSFLHNRHRFICYSSTFLSTLSCQIQVFLAPSPPSPAPQLLAEAQLGLLAQCVWVVVVWKIPACFKT